MKNETRMERGELRIKDLRFGQLYKIHLESPDPEHTFDFAGLLADVVPPEVSGDGYDLVFETAFEMERHREVSLREIIRYKQAIFLNGRKLVIPG